MKSMEGVRRVTNRMEMVQNLRSKLLKARLTSILLGAIVMALSITVAVLYKDLKEAKATINDYQKIETELKDLHYLRNYVDFNTDQVGNTKSMSFNYEGAFSFEVRVNCEEEHSLEEVKDVLKEHEEKTKEVNGIKYFYYEYKSNLSDDVHYYLYQHNNRVYSIIFFLGANHGDIEEVFMDAVKFK